MSRGEVLSVLLSAALSFLPKLALASGEYVFCATAVNTALICEVSCNLSSWPAARRAAPRHPSRQVSAAASARASENVYFLSLRLNSASIESLRQFRQQIVAISEQAGAGTYELLLPGVASFNPESNGASGVALSP